MATYEMNVKYTTMKNHQLQILAVFHTLQRFRFKLDASKFNIITNDKATIIIFCRIVLYYDYL